MSVPNPQCPEGVFCEPINGNPRFITNWTPNRTFNEFIRYKNRIQGSTDYRLFLQRNADNIIHNLRQAAICGSDCHQLKNDVRYIENYLQFPGFLYYYGRNSAY